MKRTEDPKNSFSVTYSAFCLILLRQNTHLCSGLTQTDFSVYSSLTPELPRIFHFSPSMKQHKSRTRKGILSEYCFARWNCTSKLTFLMCPCCAHVCSCNAEPPLLPLDLLLAPDAFFWWFITKVPRRPSLSVGCGTQVIEPPRLKNSRGEVHLWVFLLFHTKASLNHRHLLWSQGVSGSSGYEEHSGIKALHQLKHCSLN